MPRHPAFQRLNLADFRSWPKLEAVFEPGIVVLTGDNGAGKTNLLEALSLFAQGRGLRRADMGDFARQGTSSGWGISVEVGDEDYTVQLGTGADPPEAGAAAARKFRIDRAPVGSARAFADHIRVIWLTPAMDGLFTGSPGERRRFLDRLVLAVDAEHGSRVNALERALRNRNRLLEEPNPDRAWLDSAEREVASVGVAVAAARHDTLTRLTALIQSQRDMQSPFPWAELALTGEIEGRLPHDPALAVEDVYRQLLRDSRRRDAAAGRTLIGPHTSDLEVRHGPKQAEAGRASTGEQKALLTGLVLAHASLVTAMSGIAPILLLDEIAAHFDEMRRHRLFDDLVGRGSQVWLTGADAQAFEALRGRAQLYRIVEGTLESLR